MTTRTYPKSATPEAIYKAEVTALADDIYDMVANVSTEAATVLAALDRVRNDILELARNAG